MPDPLDVIEIQPSEAIVQKGEKRQFEAVAQDQYGNEIPELAFLWEASGGTINQEGVFTAGEEPGIHGVKVSAKFQGTTRTGSATVPVPPVWIPVGDMVHSRWNPIAVKL